MIIRVYYEDTDIGGFVYYANYLKYCERARSELFFENGLVPITQEFHFVVKSLSANYIKPAKFGDMLDVTTEAIEIKNASMKLLQKIFREGVLIFEMRVDIVSLCGDKITKLPQEVRATHN